MLWEIKDEDRALAERIALAAVTGGQDFFEALGEAAHAIATRRAAGTRSMVPRPGSGHRTLIATAKALDEQGPDPDKRPTPDDEMVDWPRQPRVILKEVEGNPVAWLQPAVEAGEVQVRDVFGEWKKHRAQMAGLMDTSDLYAVAPIFPDGES